MRRGLRLTQSAVRARPTRAVGLLFVFSSLTARWKESHGALPAVLCGMVGSSLGWTQAPYLPCPARPEQIADACASIQEGAIAVVPGLSCHNRFNAPDFMRGEETQILGALNLAAELREGRCVICLPGTHTKWVVVDEGWVREFFTAPTGEVFALLRDHSVLIRGNDGVASTTHMDAFDSGLAHFNKFPSTLKPQTGFPRSSTGVARRLNG